MTHDIFPAEIWGGIIAFLTASELRNMILVSRWFYDQTKPYMYHSVHFDNLTEHGRNGLTYNADDFLVTVNRPVVPPYNSVCIWNLDRFMEVLDQQPTLRQYVKCVTFSLSNADSLLMEKIIDCLEALSLEELHYRVPMSLNVISPDYMVSIELFCPNSYGLIRCQMHYVFGEPTLRHVCLRNARNWQGFFGPPLTRLAGSSNVTSITLLGTVPVDRDLVEILSWPKALLHYHHQNVVNKYPSVVRASALPNPRASPLALLQALDTQKTTLQSLYYNNESDHHGSVDVFGTKLLEFRVLKRLWVSQDCLIASVKRSPMAITPELAILPSSLEYLRIDQRGNLNREDSYVCIQRLWFWLRPVITHRSKYFPVLKKVIVWQEGLLQERKNQAVSDYLQKLQQELDQSEVFLKSETKSS